MEILITVVMIILNNKWFENIKLIADRMTSLLYRFELWVSGVIATVLAYFVDTKSSFHVLWLAALLHVILGIVKSYKVKKEPFQIKKFAEAVIICMVFTSFLMLVYANDTANSQDYVLSFRIVSWITTSAYIWHSVLIASDIWDKSPLLKMIKNIYSKLINKRTGIDFEEYETSKKKNDINIQ